MASYVLLLVQTRTRPQRQRTVCLVCFKSGIVVINSSGLTRSSSSGCVRPQQRHEPPRVLLHPRWRFQFRLCASSHASPPSSSLIKPLANPNFNGTQLIQAADMDIIVVTFNYRVPLSPLSPLSLFPFHCPYPPTSFQSLYSASVLTNSRSVPTVSSPASPASTTVSKTRSKPSNGSTATSRNSAETQTT